jgi:Fe-S cluster assembly protein SufD
MTSSTDTRNSTAEILSSIPAIDPVRLNARNVFEKVGLPGAKSEEYKHTPITRLLEKNFDFSTRENPSPSVTDISSFVIPELEANLIVLVNGTFSDTLSKIHDRTMVIKSMQKAAIENKPEVEKHLANYANFQQDAFAAWNTAAWTDGVFIEVKKDMIAEKPVVIHHLQDASSGEVKSISRNLILIGSGSEITVIEKFDSVGSSANFSNTVTEVVLEENASLNFFSIQADSGNRFQYGLTQFWQARASRLNCYTFTLDGKFIRNNTQVALDGEGCEAHLYGLYVLQGDTLADNHTVVDHRKPSSFSNELYKGVLDENSKGVFNGKIFVRPNAQKTNAFQSNRNILLSDRSTINTKPQLEIWADDVKCSHGCTTGQLDEEALFYLRTRGIPKETARAMILYAFASELLSTIRNEALMAYLDGLISQRLHKTF